MTRFFFFSFLFLGQHGSELTFFQGAGGNGNVLKEIVEPAGGKFEVRNLLVGDKSLSVLEIWGAEYQVLFP